MEYAKEFQMDSQEAAVRMEEGRLYLPSDEEIMKKQFDCLEKLYDYNQTRPHDQMLMYGKEASNRKQEIDRQHYTIPNQRPKNKHCGKI